MIQRIQSVYLILGVLAVAGAFLLGDLTREAHDAVAWFVPAAAGAMGLAALMGMVGLFLYSNRKRQRRAIVLTQYVTLVCVVVVILGLNASGTLPTTKELALDGWLILAFPLLGYVFFWLARRGVDADIKLLKSVDRLR